MRGTKYLSELLSTEDVLSNSNTLVLSPCGSGKTYYILNELAKGNKKVLYLCDTTNLKRSVLEEENTTTKDIRGWDFVLDNVQVMTYQAFGMMMKYQNINSMLKDYDLIIGDEVHNLIDYDSFKPKSKPKSNPNLIIAIQILFNKQIIPIVLFTATPYNIFNKNKENKTFLNDIKIIDFTESTEIRRYINKRESYISHITQIQSELHYYNEMFKFGGGKALIFTQNIEDMKSISQMALNENLKPICIWSENNEQGKVMSDEQIRVRDLILKHGTLPEPYNVLIINRAMETGVNIYDLSFGLFISGTSNYTQTYQARSRLRMDLDVVILKSDYTYIPNNLKLKLDEKWLNVPLTKEDFDLICAELNIKDGDKCLIGVTKLKTILKNNNYKITQKRLKIDNKYKRVNIISK